MNKEFDESYIIEKYFKPLAAKFKGSLNLADDVAVIEKKENKKLLVSVDNFILGVHFPESENPKDAIIRAIIVAVSDLAAMAAKPFCLFLSLSLPKKSNEELFQKLASGLRTALKLTEMKLAGGDICSYQGPLSISVTVIGKAKCDEILYRKGARIGDNLMVTGNIGDGKIGLDCILNKNYKISKIEKKRIIKKFLVPPLLFNFSYSIKKYVNACIDLSDGLMFDAGKLAKTSNCGLRVYSDKIPYSKECETILKNNELKIEDLITAGDDYQLAFAVNKKNINRIKYIASKHNIKLSVIGQFIKQKNIYLDNLIFNKGYSHI